MLFTKDQQQQKEVILAQLRDCLDEEKALQFQSELINLNKQAKQAQDERAGKVDTVFKDLADLQVDFEELMKARIYFEEDVRAYAEKRQWITAHNYGEQKSNTSKNEEKPKKPPVIVGVFKFEDYGFTMPLNNKGVAMSQATSLEWDFNKRYGPLGWEAKFIKSIKSKGWEHILSVASNEFKKWLFESKIATKGRSAGNKIFENKREFLTSFDITGNSSELDNFNLGIEEPKDEVIEPVVVQEEYSQVEQTSNEAVIEETPTEERKTFFKKGKKP